MATSNDTARLQLLEIAGTYGCMKQCSDMLNFFANPSHNQACIDAVTMYAIPKRNGYDNNGSYHKDWCSWDLGMFKFYLAVQLLYKYPLLDTTDRKNCKKIKAMQDGLETEKLNADKAFTATQDGNVHSYTINAINDIQGGLVAAYATMDCATYVEQTNTTNTLASIDAATTQDPTATTKSNSTTTIIYIVAAILVLVIAVKIFKG